MKRMYRGANIRNFQAKNDDGKISFSSLLPFIEGFYHSVNSSRNSYKRLGIT
jgi:hypothetical protein